MYKRLEDTPAYKYAEAVMEGKRSFTLDGVERHTVVGKYIRLAVERFFRDLEEGRFRLDWQKGYKPILWTEYYQRHWEGKKVGEPFLLEPHQHFHWMNQFGWLTEDDKLRFNRSYKQIARKNGKTTECSLKGTHHVAGTSQGLQCWVGATKEDQAAITINEASMFIRNNPKLQKLFSFSNKGKMVRTIMNDKSFSFMRAMGRDSNTSDGLKPSFVIIDEYHEHKDTGTIDVLESGMVNRENPIVDIITTAGFNKNYPCFQSTRKGLIDVLEGKIQNDRFFGLLYEMDVEDDYDNYELWYKANPNLGVSNHLDQLKNNYENAKMEGYAKLTNFYTKNLNMWVDAPEVWIDGKVWEQNTKGLKVEDFHGKVAYLGVDLATGDDFNSAAFMIPFNEDEFAFHCLHWLPKNRIKNRKDGNDFTNWVHEGWIKTSGEDIVDFRTIAADIIEECERFDVKTVACDPYKLTHGAMHILEDNGLKVFPIYQGYKQFAEPTKQWGEKVLQKKMEHFDNPVLAWEMGNVVLDHKDHDNYIISKKNSQNKIDGVAACIDAYALYLYEPRKRKFLFGEL